jgi:hypothetical protein
VTARLLAALRNEFVDAWLLLDDLLRRLRVFDDLVG